MALLLLNLASIIYGSWIIYLVLLWGIFSTFGGKNENNVRPKRDEGMSPFCVGELSCEEKASHGCNGEAHFELGSGKTLLDRQEKSLGRRCSGRGLTAGSPAELESQLVCSVFQSLWCKSSPRGWFPANDVRKPRPAVLLHGISTGQTWWTKTTSKAWAEC